MSSSTAGAQTDALVDCDPLRCNSEIGGRPSDHRERKLDLLASIALRVLWSRDYGVVSFYFEFENCCLVVGLGIGSMHRS